jgi:hypothetical protein
VEEHAGEQAAENTFLHHANGEGNLLGGCSWRTLALISDWLIACTPGLQPEDRTQQLEGADKRSNQTNPKDGTNRRHFYNPSSSVALFRIKGQSFPRQARASGP